MERKHFVPVTKQVGVGLAATAFLAVGVACTSATQGEAPSTAPESSQVSAVETPVLNEKNLIKTGQWGYMPGTTLEPDGLHVEYRGFKIVQQDGSGGQSNPPVNEYGTHLEVPKDFSLKFRLSNIVGPASLQFYESPPMVSDEFRVEPKSIRFTFDGDKWTAQRWDGDGQQHLSTQTAAETMNFIPTPGSQQSVEIVHSNRSLYVAANGQPLGIFPAGDTFAGGQLWLGADAEAPDGHFVISGLEAEARNGGKVMAVDTSKSLAVKKRADGLQELASKKRPDFKIGGSIALWAMVSNSKYHDRMFGGDFGKVTPEEAGKRQFTEPLPGVYDFHQLDAIVAEARKNKVEVHGHNLLFNEARPQWLETMPTVTPTQKETVIRLEEAYATALVGHFKGVIDEWDLNELFADPNDDGSMPTIFRDSALLRAGGEPGIVRVMRAAYKANPSLKLWNNHYGAETDNGQYWQTQLKWMKKWKYQDHLPIGGFGFQAHVYDTGTDLIVNKDGQAPELQAHIQQLAQDGFVSRISEADAPAAQSEYDISSQSQQFVGEINTCMSLSSCKEMGFWSIAMTDLWQENDALQRTSVDSIFDQSVNPTPAYRALQKYLRTG